MRTIAEWTYGVEFADGIPLSELPYGIDDAAIGVATVPLSELLGALEA